ncbi:alpha/beta-hydrolase [Coprinellus micaceus]|uniref:Acyl-protein thioesterase 1 n=1 Tax=Coprinellus micaceus TaxID=71717 RepID=A0A4Y7TD99_COPMI|nr:alpha/beta-hydrolase [Coprinellus micaceus]
MQAQGITLMSQRSPVHSRETALRCGLVKRVYTRLNVEIERLIWSSSTAASEQLSNVAQEAILRFSRGVSRGPAWLATVLRPIPNPAIDHPSSIGQFARCPGTKGCFARAGSTYGIYHPTPSEYDEESIKKSVSTIQGLIRREVDAGTNVKDIFLVGFSQGAATSLCAGLTSQDEIGGIVSLSGWIPEAHRHAIYCAPPFPILWCHGTNDKEIPLSYGRDAEGFIKALSKEGASPGLQAGVITFKTYEGLDHSTNDTELEDIAAWLSTQLQL